METLRERKKERTRQAILAAATQLFATKGYSETTITEIAEAAEVGRRTFFSYFPTKEILIFGALERRLDRLEATLAELPPPIALSTMLDKWIEIDAADRTKGDKRDRYHQILQLSSTEPELQLAELRHRQHARPPGRRGRRAMSDARRRCRDSSRSKTPASFRDARSADPESRSGRTKFRVRAGARPGITNH